MKLILANNHSEKFEAFYDDLSTQSSEPFDYAAYQDLLFVFDTALQIQVLSSGRTLTDYDGLYITGYLNTYELAATVAIACDARAIAYADHELHAAPSLSKLTMYAKLAAAGVPIPRTFAGTKHALLKAQKFDALQFPAVLKRADADRGIDNYMIHNLHKLADVLADHRDRSLWVLQEFVANNGFYRLGFYGNEAKFCIFRSLEDRPDGNAQKRHMFKPKGGGNAELIAIENLPSALVQTCRTAVAAMDRQIAGVDCLYNPETDQVIVLEVNYNPQLVTINTFKDERTQAFLDYLTKLGEQG